MHELLLECGKFRSLLLRQSQPSAFAIEQHLLDETLFLRAQFFPFSGVPEALLGGYFGVIHIETHGRLDIEVIDKRFSVMRGVSQFLAWGDILVESQGLRNLTQIGFCFRKS